MNKPFLLSLLLLVCLVPCRLHAQDPDAKKLVKEAVEYWRGSSSYFLSEMTIHRPDWERTSVLESWTKGLEHSLVRFSAPPKDAGNASLMVEDDVWTFSPKINRVIKIPPSMKSQSWMGSDFSYRDLAKADDIIDEYTHKIIGREEHDGQPVYVVESIPFETAPIVWGKEVIRIREDRIIVQHQFFDQDGKLVKQLTAREIKEVGGKLYATQIRMEKLEENDEWTEIRHTKVEFNLDVPNRMFTLSNLRNPRQRSID